MNFGVIALMVAAGPRSQRHVSALLSLEDGVTRSEAAV
jgi:hypothetical protein